MRQQMRQARNMGQGMITKAFGQETEVVEVRPLNKAKPKDPDGGVIIVTRADLFRNGGGRHFRATEKLPVLR